MEGGGGAGRPVRLTSARLGGCDVRLGGHHEVSRLRAARLLALGGYVGGCWLACLDGAVWRVWAPLLAPAAPRPAAGGPVKRRRLARDIEEIVLALVSVALVVWIFSLAAR